MLPLHPLSAQTQAAMAYGGLDVDAVTALIGLAIREDLLDGRDVTSEATIPAGQRSHGSFGARAEGVVAGLPVAAAVIEMLCGPEASEVRIVNGDGSRVSPGDVLATVTGPTSRLLTAERTALNFLCHLSGVATLTGQWVDAIEGTSAMVHDTRKTNPGMRSLEKYAVRCGGGVNHRMALSDMALVKDNHVVAAGGIEQAIRQVKQLDPSIPVEIEVDTIDALRVAIGAGVDEILIDNFSLDMMREAVAVRDRTRPEVRLEASGGLTSETARAVARTGVDLIAVGELTHSARVLDIGLDLETVIE
jgi:nicotinate-nucleotide pyrophosphorylase (carboxylating)